MFKNELNELLEITDQNEMELIYLAKLAKTMDKLEEAKEHIFQFSPSFDENGRNESFAVFYKRSIISEIVFTFIDEYSKKEKRIDEEGMRDDFIDYFYDLFLEEPEDFFVTKFILKNDLSGLNKKEIIKKFIKHEGIKENFEEYFKLSE